MSQIQAHCGTNNVSLRFKPRYTGLKPMCFQANTHRAAEHLRSRIPETCFETEVGEVHLTPSIGVAEYGATSQDLD